MHSVERPKLTEKCRLVWDGSKFDDSILCSMALRTEEECAQINQLLEAKNYDAISEMNLEIIKTTSGTVYVK